MSGHGVYGESLYLLPSAQLFCEPKATLKSKKKSGGGVEVGMECEGLQ